MNRVRSTLPWLGLLVTVLFSYLAVRSADPQDAWAALRSSNPWWLIPAFGLLVVTVALRSVRWRSVFAPDSRPPQSAVAGALLVGYFFNNVLPARAGEAARVLALHRASAKSRAEIAATVVVERVFDVTSLVVLLFVATPWLPHVSWTWSAAILAGALGLGIAGIALWGEGPLRLLLRPLALLPFIGEQRLAAAATNLTGGLAAIRRPRLAATAFAWTTLSWLALGLSTWFVLVAFHLGLSPLAGMLVVIAINLALVLPSSPAGLGVFEAATLVALSRYGVSSSRALPTALVLHLLNLVPYLVAGGLVLQRAGALRAVRADPGGGGRSSR